MSASTQIRTVIGLAAALLMLPVTASSQTLDKAYQKEVSYLTAQKSALQKRVSALEREAATAKKSENGELAALQNRLVALQLEGDSLQEQLADVERDSARTEDHAESLLAVFEQAKASLNRYDVEVTAPDVATPESVRDLFASAARVLDESAATRTQAGSYFGPDGRRLEGEITYVGRVAAFAGETPLAPAGDGLMKAWSGPASGGVFLFESVEKAVEEKTEQTVLETIEAGGIIAWVIVVLGLLAALLVAARVFLLGVSSRNSTERVVDRARSVADLPLDIAQDAIAQAILEEQPRVERFGTAIMVFAAVAPLLGLLGTVTGMIATFDIITEYGTGDPKMLSSGISEALITTQLGLMVAIPALLIGNLLNAWGAKLLDGFEFAALCVLNARAARRPMEMRYPEAAE